MVNFFVKHKEYGAFFIRFLLAFHLIKGVLDNIVSWDQMLEFKHFLGQAGFPVPLVCAVVSVYLQFICGILIGIGYKVRWAALVMVVNFVIAILMVHLKTPYEATFPTFVMLFGSLFLLFNGAGKPAIDKM